MFVSVSLLIFFENSKIKFIDVWHVFYILFLLLSRIPENCKNH